MEKEMRMIEMKMRELCEELLLDIFSRVPSKPLTRMKCVSKEWCRLISDLQSPSLRTVASGLIRLQVQCNDDMVDDCDSKYPPFRTPLKLFDVKDQGGELVYLENNALGFTLNGPVESLCFTNGMLLCCYEIDRSHYDPFLYDLFLKELISFPSFKEFLEHHPYGIGLAFDGNRNHHFKVVCFFFSEDVKFLDCMIFSSETGEWSKHRPQLKNYSIILEDLVYSNQYYRSETVFQFESLYHEGLIYWTIWGYFLVYNLQDNFFEIHNLPTKEQDQYCSVFCSDECFWVSEGCLHYCCSDKNGFYVWTWIKGEALDCEHSWKLNHRVYLETLKAQHPEFPGWINFLKPCSFNKDFQSLYLQLANSLVASYSFETGYLREVKHIKYY